LTGTGIPKNRPILAGTGIWPGSRSIPDNNQYKYQIREKELRRLRRETEESFRTCERLLHALTFQRKMLEAVLKIRDREIQVTVIT
jgi:hypothetical protein